jgi:hypothetical protein
LRTTTILFSAERVKRCYPQTILEHLIVTAHCVGMTEKLTERYQLHLAPAVLANIDGWRGKQPELLLNGPQEFRDLHRDHPSDKL